MYGSISGGCMATALATLALLLTGCGDGGEDAAGTNRDKLDVVGYSGFASAYRDALEPAFAKTFEGEGVSFGNSFGASGEQSRAVAEGQSASVVHFSQAGDMERLVEEGRVDADWDQRPYHGIANRSVVVFIVRQGNPMQIHNVGDLLSKDVDVITPNPIGDRSARWNIMDIYATLIHERKSEAEALAGVRTVLEKTVVQPSNGADALAAFMGGRGDVLIAHESEAIQAVDSGRRIRFVVPHRTMLIETPIAVTEDAPEPAAEDFLDFIWSEEGQIIWAENGFRPANPRLVDQERFFPRVGFRIKQFGGWAKVNEEFFDAETGSVARIEAELGVLTDG